MALSHRTHNWKMEEAVKHDKKNIFFNRSNFLYILHVILVAPGTAPEDLTITESQSRDDYLYISWQPPSQPNGRIVSYQIYSNTDRNKPLNRWAQDGMFRDYSGEVNA